MFKRLTSYLLLTSLFLSTQHVMGQEELPVPDPIQQCDVDDPFCPPDACSPGGYFCNGGFESGDIGWCWRNGYGSNITSESGIVSYGHNSPKALKVQVTMGPPELFFNSPLPPDAPTDHYAKEVIYLQDGFGSSKFTGKISGGYSSVRHCYNFTKGITYKGTVWLKSDDNVVVEFLFRRGPDYYEAYAANRITVSSEWTQYEIVGGFDQNVENGSLEINFVTLAPCILMTQRSVMRFIQTN